MTIWRDIEGASTTPSARRTAVTIGNFDGVHRGHQTVLRDCREDAGDLPVVALTFDPHPLAIVSPDRVPARLTSLERRVELLLQHGADEVRVLAFSREMASWAPEDFVTWVIVEQLAAMVVHVGDNFRYGHRAAGNIDSLRESGKRLGFRVDGLPILGDGEGFSSTRIRAEVAEGDLRAAAHGLGRPHEVSGVVVHGDHRGRELGFPTANVVVDETYAVPPDGVYAGHVVRATGERMPAAISIGTNPTFDGVQRRIESNVIDRTDLDLYGEAIRVELVERLRGMVKYEGVEALVDQMNRDVDQVRAITA